jgi:hypothetical protein
MPPDAQTQHLTIAPFLSRSTHQGLVIYLALEEKRSEVKRHFQTMGQQEAKKFIFMPHVHLLMP